MRVINPFLVISLAILSGSAWAVPSDSYLFNVKTQSVDTKPQPAFWDVLFGRAKLDADLTVKVTDAATGLPMAGAAVMVGTKNGDPFTENVVRTDEAGLAAFTHESLRTGTPFPITVGKAGFTVVSLLQNTNNVVDVALQKIQGERDYGFMRGKLTGFPPGFDSGTLELGLFVPATRPADLLSFDLGLFVSSYKVKIDVYGEREVPGNAVLPDQSKRWGLIPLSFNKPDYVMPLPNGLETHMAGMVGSVAISPAVTAIRNKDFISVLNITSFNHVGWTSRRVKVSGDDNFDINARHEVTPAVLTSKVSGVPEKLDVVSISLVDPEGDGGDFVAMDIKAQKAEEVKNGNTQFKLGMLKNRVQGAAYYIFTGIFDRKQLSSTPLNIAATPDYRWIVGSTKPVGSARAAETRFSSFLKQMKPQGVGQGNREYRFSAASNSKVEPDFTMVNIVSEKQNQRTQGVTRAILWSSIVQGGITQLNLPDLGRPVLPNPDSSKGERFFWEVVAIKTRQPAKSELDLQSALRNVEHVSSFTKAF